MLLLISLLAACNRVGRLVAPPPDRGGSYLVLAVEGGGTQLEQNIAQTIAVMQKRCEQLDIYCNLQREGGAQSNRLRLRISSTLDPERVKSILLSEGLELRAVVSPPSPAPSQSYPTRAQAEEAVTSDNQEVLPYLDRGDGPQTYVIVERAPVITGQHVSSAEARSNEATSHVDKTENYTIAFELNPTGAERLGNWTAANINNYLAFIFNRQVRTVAFIKSQITNSGEISGRFTKQQAEDMVLVMRSGNLPAKIQALEEGTYRP
ncbi:MAG TPA: hypothetical protein VJT09_08665 [Pyrinomonadaceae bacterium]|nr:hypothetical protein [Pyrinomonadaceae bacterium]